jgi:hypothetical protein
VDDIEYDYERVTIDLDGRQLRVQINVIAGRAYARVLELRDDGHWWDIDRRNWEQTTVYVREPWMGNRRSGNE